MDLIPYLDWLVLEHDPLMVFTCIGLLVIFLAIRYRDKSGRTIV